VRWAFEQELDLELDLKREGQVRKSKVETGSGIYFCLPFAVAHALSSGSERQLRLRGKRAAEQAREAAS